MSGKLKLGTKFTLLLLLVFLGGIVLSGVTLSSAMQRKVEEEVTNTAEILTHTINSLTEYTSNNISPLLRERASWVVSVKLEKLKSLSIPIPVPNWASNVASSSMTCPARGYS